MDTNGHIKKSMKSLIRVGITGEMGSGKSFVANLFAERGVPVYNCDNRSKWCILNNNELIVKIKQEFGENIYTEGESVFKNLSKITFIEGDRTKLDLLMSLVSPYFNADLDAFCETHKDEKFCLIESAILYESKMNEGMDKVIYVTASEEVRIRRAMDRDGITEEHYKIRMKNQMDSIEKIKRSDFVIYNQDMTMDELNYHIAHIYNFYSGNQIKTFPYSSQKHYF